MFSNTKKPLPHTVVSEIDKLITQAQSQLRKIKRCIRSLNITIIKDSKGFSKEKRADIQNHFSELILLIESMESEPFRTADLQSCQVLIDFNSNLIEHLDTIRRNRFKNIKSFDIKNFLQKLQRKKSISGPEIIKKFKNTYAILKLIEAEGLGLTKLNKIVRLIDNKIITPSLRYSLPSRSLMALATIFIGNYYWWHFAPNNFKKNVPSWWYDNFFGKHPTGKVELDVDQVDQLDPFYQLPNRNNNNNENGKSPFGLFAKIEKMWIFNNKGLTPLGTFIGAALLSAYAGEFYRHILPGLQKKLSAWINKGKGGAYVKEAERIEEKTDKVRFRDIYGHDEIKRYFKFLVDYIEDSETHDRQGIRPSRGVLCIGDTRTGKTFCINAFLEEVNQMLIRTNQIGKFRLIKPSVLKIKIDGMEKILQHARRNAPCILFIDEIDLLDLQRTGENRTLSEFLTAMSEAINTIDSKKQVFIIAATNCPETLDKALRQPGRFGKELRFEYPNFKDRFNFIESKVSEFILPNQKELFDFEKLSHYTNNQSYEAINLFIKDAMMKAKIDNNGELTQQHLETALEEDIYHIIPACTKDIPEDEQRILAAHFAGQAFMLSTLESSLKLGKVTIKQVMTELKEEVMGSRLYKDSDKEQQRFEFGKIFTYHDLDSINLQTREEKLALIKMNVAGFVAEEILLGTCGYSCHVDNDHSNALNLAKSLTFQGIDETTLPKHLVKNYYDKALEIKEHCIEEVKDLLSNNKEKLSHIMEKLIEHQTLDQVQIEQMLAPVA